MSNVTVPSAPDVAVFNSVVQVSSVYSLNTAPGRGAFSSFLTLVNVSFARSVVVTDETSAFGRVKFILQLDKPAPLSR